MKHIALGVALVALAAPALAGGLNQPAIEPAPLAPAPAPVAAGPDWSGFYAGGQLGFGDVDAGGGATGDGLLGGVHAGYRFDFGGFVAGVEADYDAADIDLGGGTGLDDVLRLKLSGGVPVGAGLLYATAGAAQAGVDLGASSDRDTGVFGGVGVAWPVGSNLTLGGEILQHQFDDFAGSGSDISATTATARVSFRF
jgi:predicted porin